MKQEIAEAIVSAGREIYGEGDGRSPIRLFAGYAGRGMFGKTTTGVVVDSESILLKTVALASARWHEADQSGDAPFSFERFMEGLDLRRDSYGDGVIVY